MSTLSTALPLLFRSFPPHAFALNSPCPWHKIYVGLALTDNFWYIYNRLRSYTGGGGVCNQSLRPVVILFDQFSKNIDNRVCSFYNCRFLWRSLDCRSAKNLVQLVCCVSIFSFKSKYIGRGGGGGGGGGGVMFILLPLFQLSVI